MEKLIIEFPLSSIQNLSLVDSIVEDGYNKTGNKFWVNFCGSKGYLSHIEIFSETTQTEENNIIWINGDYLKLQNSDKNIKVFHSPAYGVRIDIDRFQFSLAEKQNALEISLGRPLTISA